MRKAKEEGIRDLLGTQTAWFGKKGKKKKKKKKGKGNNRKDTEDGNETFLHDGSLE